MPRSERLLRLVVIFRRHHYLVSGQNLACDWQISLRTLHRDIATLQSQGAEIVAEAGIGYILKHGFTLPAPMFSVEEIEAVLLGARFVMSRTDDELSKAARSALTKIKEVLPQPMIDFCDKTTSLIAPPSSRWRYDVVS